MILTGKKYAGDNEYNKVNETVIQSLKSKNPAKGLILKQGSDFKM